MSGLINSLLPSQAGLTTGSEGIIQLGTGDGRPGGVESILEYNGSLFNVRKWVDTFIINSIDGLADADVRDTREVNPNRHGETYFDAYYGGRTIVLTGKIRAHTLWKLRDMQMGLKQVFGDISKELPLRFRTGDVAKDVVINCKKSQPIVMAEAQQNFLYERDFQVTLRASDPFFESYLEAHGSGRYGAFEQFSQNVEYKGDVNIADNPEFVTTDGLTTGSPVTSTTSASGNSAKVLWTGSTMSGLTAAYARVFKRNANKFECQPGVQIGLYAVVFSSDWTGGSVNQLGVRLQFFDASNSPLGSQNYGSVVPGSSGSLEVVSGSWPAPADAAFFQVEIYTSASTTGVGRSAGIDQLTLVINPTGGFVDQPFNGTIMGAWLGTPHQSMSVRRSKDGLEAYDKGGSWYSSNSYDPSVYVEDGHLRIYNMNGWTLQYLRKTTEDIEVADARYSIRYKTGAVVQHSSSHFDLIVKRIDSDNWLTARVSFSSATASVSLLKLETLSSVTLTGSALAVALTPNTEYKFSVEFNGNAVKIIHQKADGTAINTWNYTLTGGDALKFGAGVIGRYGLATYAGDWPDWWFDDHNVEPAADTEAIKFTIANAGNASARPKIRVYGPLYAASNNGPGADISATTVYQGATEVETMRINAVGNSIVVIPETQYIEIDSRARTVKAYTLDGNFVRNAFEQLDVTSDWITIRPGSTTLNLASFSYGSPRLEIAYHHTYI